MFYEPIVDNEANDTPTILEEINTQNKLVQTEKLRLLLKTAMKYDTLSNSTELLQETFQVKLLQVQLTSKKRI
jgi:hypothetical protein